MADDLTRRARNAVGLIAGLANAGLPVTVSGKEAIPVGRRALHEWSALVSELADEVDRLRAEADRYRTLWDRHGKNDLLAERDAARAALERVRAVVETVDHRDDTGTYVDIDAITRALEGKP